MGICVGFGIFFFVIFVGINLFEGNGFIFLLGVCIILLGIVIIGYVGSFCVKNMSEEEKCVVVKDFVLIKGLLVVLLVGVMSVCFVLGFDVGMFIKEVVLVGGVEGFYVGFFVIFLVILGGFLINVVYCL